MKEKRDSLLLVEMIKKALLERPGRKLLAEPREFETPKAAVALILKLDLVGGDASMLLIERKVRDNDPWSGNMALPGGRFSKVDKSLLETVLREVSEETGLDQSDYSILGTLDEVVSTNFLVRVKPYVALLEKSKGDLILKIDAKEIESYVWIPVAYFREKKNMTALKVEQIGRKIEMPCYRYGEKYVIWGMTLRIIEDLLRRID